MSVKEQVSTIWRRPRSSVVKDFPRLSKLTTVRANGQLLSANGTPKETLLAIILALGNLELHHTVEQNYELHDLESLITNFIKWDSNVGLVLRLVTQSIPAPVSVHIAENLHAYSIQQGEWSISIQVKQNRIRVQHARQQFTSLPLQPNTTTPQKNFAFKWKLNIFLKNINAPTLHNIAVAIPIKNLLFVDSETLNPSFRIKICNLLSILQTTANAESVI